ncbi:MAG: tRNA lysidine(34) synthetase TilS [Chitinophagaceae bacterium]|nr:tRNA lysidine(34) synthetase TilS [Chitinophagaceae bacterium]
MLLDKFKEYIATNHLFQPKDMLLLAVSGGIDSVVLCELCHRAGYQFVIAHCNFQLRGAESERDENFVRSLGEKYGVKVFIKKFDTEKYAREHKKSIQEAARDLRYKWFLQICTDGSVGRVSETKSDKPGWNVTIEYAKPRTLLVTAHHANDSVETMLMNFFKGTGIKGLQGIKPRHELLLYLIRPLLFAKKEELVAFAIQNNLPFAEDSSNKSDKYTRNYFRNQLIPDLKKVYPQVEDNLIDNLHRFHEIEILYQQSIQLHKKKLLEQKGNEVHIPVLKLLKTQPLATVLYEIIKEYNFTAHQTEETINLLKSETGKYINSHTHRIFKNRHWLIITPNQTTEAQNILIEESDTNIHFEGGMLKIEKAPAFNFQLSTFNSIAQLDAATIKFPLLLRKWKQGDYFYPLGMQKKKKLSRFFIDQKLSLTEKENAWLIEMNKKIIWIVGMRIDNRFKITASTKEVLKVTLTQPV